MSAPLCCLCGQLCEPWHAGATGFGNNPDPFGHDGDRCCDGCNAEYVIPERLARMAAGRSMREGDER